MIISVFVNTNFIIAAFITGLVFGITAGWLCGCGYGFIYGLWHKSIGGQER